MDEKRPPIQVHLEPDAPIELDELTRALAAIAHQFEDFSVRERFASRSRDVKIYVTSVHPGSIEIGLIPVLLTAGLLAPALQPKSIQQFAEMLEALIGLFNSGDGTKGQPSVRDCEDVAALMAPVANHGGKQTINIVNGDQYQTVIQVTGKEAQQIAANAMRRRAELQFPESKVVQRVPLVWAQMDKDEARQGGKRSPDKGIIEDIDEKPKPVFFEDEYAYLKDEMLLGDENAWTKIYFVDVLVSRVSGRVVSYKVVGFHGTADLESPGDNSGL